MNCINDTQKCYMKHLIGKIRDGIDGDYNVEDELKALEDYIDGAINVDELRDLMAQFADTIAPSLRKASNILRDMAADGVRACDNTSQKLTQKFSNMIATLDLEILCKVRNIRDVLIGLNNKYASEETK